MTTRPLLPLACLAVLALGCPPAPRPPRPELEPRELERISAALPPLTAAVEAAARRGALPAGAGGEEALAAAAREDPGLVAPFAGYRVRAEVEGGHAALLVCLAAEDVALLEDLGCTPALDFDHWRSTPPPPCAFQAALQDACGALEP